MSSPGYTFILARWAKEKELLSDIQQQLFSDQSIVISNETADDAFHILVFDGGGRTVGTARMQPDGKVEYVGVLRPWRGNTVGTAVMTYLRHIGETTKINSLWAMVPETLQPFFEKNGFQSTGEKTVTGNNALQKMVRPLVKGGETSAVLH